MSIKIKRNSGIIASDRSLSVLANGKEKAKIANLETLQLNLKKYPAEVQVRSFDMQSNIIKVHTGEELEIKKSFQMPILFCVCILIILVGNILIDNMIIPPAIAFIIYMLAYKKVNTFKIVVTKTNEVIKEKEIRS